MEIIFNGANYILIYYDMYLIKLIKNLFKQDKKVFFYHQLIF